MKVVIPVEQTAGVIMPDSEQTAKIVIPAGKQTATGIMPVEFSTRTIIPTEQSAAVVMHQEEEIGGEDITFSGYETSKQPIPNTVIVHWHTTPNTKGKIRWRIKGSSGNWKEIELETTFQEVHTRNTTMQCTPGVGYELNAYGITEGGTEEWNMTKYIKISEAGEPEFQY